MKLTKRTISLFQKKIFTWWGKHKRDLPWRHTYNPYHIFVSEVMLQQTQVNRVIFKYQEFVKRYPTIADLANSSIADILRMWKGMGYNRRALYLHRASNEVVSRYNGTFPSDLHSLLSLSGVGPYTARAIQVFAYRKDVAMIDTNIRKIITHVFFHDIIQKDAIILDVARQLVPKGKAWQWHQALMDYGALALSKVVLLQTHNRGEKKITVPFKQSDRYIRGKILDDVRVTSTRVNSLQKKYGIEYNISDERFIRVLSGLAKDGLIEVLKGIVCLPK